MFDCRPSDEATAHLAQQRCWSPTTADAKPAVDDDKVTSFRAGLLVKTCPLVVDRA
jgi:hypothetical protein